MKRSILFKEELELDEVLSKQNELHNRLREYERNHREIERNRAENERTIPPLREIMERERWRQHEETVTRGEVANVRRDQNQGLLLLFLLTAATCTLIWWGLRLMQGG